MKTDDVTTNKIAHIGIAVKDIMKALPFYTDILGLEHEGISIVESENVKVAFFTIGDSKIELLEPLNDTSAIHTFLARNGEGIHHIALEVNDIEKRLENLKLNDIRLINESPKLGANDTKIAFLHPKSTNGVLFELCEHK